MVIWLLTSEFPPDFGGGISTYCIETAQMLSSYGCVVTVITQDFHATNLTITKKDNYTICRFNPSKYYTSSFLGYETNLSYAFAQAVKELIEKEGAPDIIESQEYMGIAYYLLQYKWLKYPIFKDLKVLVTLHAPSFLYLEYNKVPTYQLPYYWIGEMERFCIRSADLLVSPSQYLVNQLSTRVKIDDLNINILKNPYKTPENFTKTPIKKNEFVFFGKLTPQKGCLELINFFKKLWKEGSNISLTMIGGGNHLYHPEGVDMIDYIKTIGDAEIKNGKLKLLGAIRPEDLNQYLANAHVIIIPSTVDNLPYTVPEVMSHGKIVLASAQGGQSEIIENDTDGFIFDHNNPDSFKTQLAHILSLSENTLERIAEQAIQTIKKDFNYYVIYEKKIALLKALISNKNNPTQFPFLRPQNQKKSITAIGVSDQLSVVVPYYNMGQYVEECISSVFASTYKNIDVIIVNDGSTGEENLEILGKLADKYPIKIINKTNEGLALARNSGAKAAGGEYLAFLDPDDTIDATYYTKAISVLKKYKNVHFVGCWAKYFGGATGYWPAFNPEPPYLLIHNMVNSSALIYKREAFITAGLNDPKMVFGMEDYESVISMVEQGYQGLVLPEPLWNYRVRKDSMARAFTKNKQLYLYTLIAEKHKIIYSTFGAETANLLNANGPGFNYDNPTFFHNFPGNSSIGNNAKRLIINMIKSNPTLRKIAIKIKNSL
jgi:glycosyltransferase involved in cell wall biosynthesis